MPTELDVRIYAGSDGRSRSQNGFEEFADGATRGRIRQRIARIRLGNFGDARSVGEGVQELRIHFGPGYRIYFGREGDAVVILLCGGDKGTQDRDIRRAGVLARLQGSTPMTKTRRYEEVLDEDLEDPAEAAAYLNACLQDEDPEVFLLALRDVARARGGVAKLAEMTDLNREHLYRMLSEKGNPELRSLEALLDALGFRLAVTQKEAS